MLTIVDNFSRESIAIDVGFSLRAEDVIKVLNHLKIQRGVPEIIKTDNGSEFSGNMLDRWAFENGVKLHRVFSMTWIDKLFGTDTEETITKSQTRPELLAVQKVLTSVDQEKAPYIACVELLAARLAGADSEISPGEKQRIAEILQKQTQLSPDEANAAAEISTAQELANSIEHYQIIKFMNEIATKEQKYESIRALFYIACDDDISEVESEKIRMISRALLIPNEQYINIRSEFSQHRSVLKT